MQLLPYFWMFGRGNDGLVTSMDNFEYISELNHGNIFIFKIISLNRTKTIPVQDFTFHNCCYDHIFLITFSFTPPWRSLFFVQAKKKEGSSHLPEERQRYWNAYILVYEARADHKAPRTPKKSFSGTTSSYRRSVGPSMQRRLTLPPRISEPGQPGTESQVKRGYCVLCNIPVSVADPDPYQKLGWIRNPDSYQMIRTRIQQKPIENRK